MVKIYVQILAVLVFYSCNKDCTSIKLIGLNDSESHLNSILITDHISNELIKDSLFRFSGNKLNYDGTDGVPERRSIIVFPYNGKPSQSNRCNIRIKKRQIIPFKLYYDSSFDSLIVDGRFENTLEVMNSILAGFQNGYTFELKDKIMLDDYNLKSTHGDQIFKDLKKKKIMDERFMWHLILLNNNANVSGASAFHTQSYDHHLIISDDFLINNPIVLLHEFMHGFIAHVDLELDDYTINDPSEVVQNIMYNYDIPLIPRYSYYQNIFANGILGSNYLGINAFPYEESPELEDWNLINRPPKENKKAEMIRYVKPLEDELDNPYHLYEDYFSALLLDPVQNYLYNFEENIYDYPELINSSHLLEDLIKEGSYSKLNNMWLSSLEMEAKYLQMHGLENIDSFLSYRIKKHKEMRMKKITAWEDATSSCAVTPN